MIPTNPELRQFINRYFSDEELETLCFDYFPEAANDFGGGMSKSRKVIALIGHCERRERLADLHAAVARERPEAWNRTFAPQPVETPRRDVSPTAIERDPRQIFLSHATADAEFAQTLAADLRAEGWRVWIAPESIQPGEKWVEAIDRGLETSGVFVVALTPAAVASRWVNTETDAAVEMQHEGVITFIPLDVAESHPKRLWRQYQYISFRGGYEVGLDALLRRLDDGPPLIIHSIPRPTIDQLVKAIPTDVELLKKQPDKMFPGTISHMPEFRIHEKTGIELVRIPAGPFRYGDEKQEIEVPEFWIGRYPVTNAQYKRFLDAMQDYRVPFIDEGWAKIYNWDKKSRAYPINKADHPVVLVNWHDANAFCDWAGLALPSEEQWEKAARGTDGRLWPWGDEPPTAEYCNFNRNVGTTTPVGFYSPLGDSPYGCGDMTGNTWEWLGSWYHEGKSRAMRGGSWGSDEGMRTSYRGSYTPKALGNGFGFRVVEHLSDPVS